MFKLTQMLSDRRSVGILVTVILVVAAALWFWKSRPPEVRFGCVTETREVVAENARFMAGVVEEGKTYEALMGFYACNPPQAGDVVLYRFSPTSDPVMRIVRGSGGDRFEVVADKARGAWNLKINGDLVMAGDKPYFFGGRTKPTLSLYEKDRPDGLGEGEVILLSNIPPGGEDSGAFGIVHKNDLIAKIRVP